MKYLLDKDGTRLMDDDGNYLPPVSDAEAEDYEGETCDVARFCTKQGYDNYKLLKGE